MALQMQTFHNITPAIFAAFQAKVEKDTGVKLEEDSGEVAHGSFTFTYAYDPTSETLQVQCLKKPLFIPAASIVNGIAEEVAGVITSTLEAATIIPPAPAKTE